MKLLFLHGAPAVGKLTVAKAIHQAISSKLFDNHAAIDLALTVFDFGEAGFWELVQTIRVSVLNSAAEQGVPLVIMTYCYSDPEDKDDFEAFDGAIKAHGGEMLPVYLSCSEAEAARRVGSRDRVERGKIATMLSLKNFNTEFNLISVPRDNCLKLDTGTRTAKQTAQDIIEHFKLV